MRRLPNTRDAIKRERPLHSENSPILSPGVGQQTQQWSILLCRMGLSLCTTLSFSWLVQMLSLQAVVTSMATVSIQCPLGTSLEKSHVCGDEEIPGCSLTEALAGAP